MRTSVDLRIRCRGRSFASTRPHGGNRLRWSLNPAFKSDANFLGACALVVELAEANAHLLVEYADAQGR